MIADAPHRYAWRPAGLIAAALFGALLATAGRYGYHRDELYFLVAGRHPAWGYDDQPPLVPLMAALLDTLAPGNLVVLRTPSALALAATVMVVAAIAREMGADRAGQALAAAVAAVAPFLVAVGHLLSTATFEVLFGAILTWLLARWIRTGDDRLLIISGAVTGVALLNKTLIAFLVAALVAGQPRLLRRPAFWVGALIALAIWAPNLWWQAEHGWPQLAMADSIRADEPGGGRFLLVPMQFLLFGPITVFVWIAGLWSLRRGPFRGFGIAYLLLVGTFLVLGGQVYYPAGGYAALFAAGAIATVGWVRRGVRGDADHANGAHRHVPSMRAVLVIGAVALNAVSTVAVSLPVYPVRMAGSSPSALANDDSLETIGWPEFVAAVERVYLGLPPEQRANAIILTANYGEAGAIERFGRDRPPVYSGHNAYWRWGPPPDGVHGPVLVVGDFTEAFLRQRCGSLEQAARFDNGFGVGNEEQGAPIRICRDLRGTWSLIWPELRHLG